MATVFLENCKGLSLDIMVIPWLNNGTKTWIRLDDTNPTVTQGRGRIKM